MEGRTEKLQRNELGSFEQARGRIEYTTVKGWVAGKNTKGNRTMDSDEYTTDDGKIKSNQSELKGIFGRPSQT